MRKLGIIVFVMSLILINKVFCLDNYLQNYINLYNNTAYNEIYDLYSETVVDVFSKDDNLEYFKNIKNVYGNIIDLEEHSVKIPFDVYKAIFENGILTFKIAINENQKIIGFSFEEYINDKIIETETRLSLPFSGEWFVRWGGDTEEENYHIINVAQQGAIDFLRMDKDGKTHINEGNANTDYYAFGEDIKSPINGTILMVVDGLKDNIPGEQNSYFVFGNTVVIRTENSEIIYIGHFKQNSIVVKEGQLVKIGDKLGLCGNSGNSSEPHIHIHMQNNENIDKAIGVKIIFEKIIVNGMQNSEYEVKRGEFVENF